MLAHTTPEQLAGDPIARKAFSVALLASDFYLPVEGDAQQQADAGGVSLQAVMINNQPHVVLFSSEDRMNAFAPSGTRFARAGGSSFFPSSRLRDSGACSWAELPALGTLQTTPSASNTERPPFKKNAASWAKAQTRKSKTARMRAERRKSSWATKNKSSCCETLGKTRRILSLPLTQAPQSGKAPIP